MDASSGRVAASTRWCNLTLTNLRRYNWTAQTRIKGTKIEGIITSLITALTPNNPTSASWLTQWNRRDEQRSVATTATALRHALRAARPLVDVLVNVLVALVVLVVLFIPFVLVDLSVDYYLCELQGFIRLLDRDETPGPLAVDLNIASARLRLLAPPYVSCDPRATSPTMPSTRRALTRQSTQWSRARNDYVLCRPRCLPHLGRKLLEGMNSHPAA